MDPNPKEENTESKRSILDLSLDEYYERHVVPRIQATPGHGRYPSQYQMRRQYQRTHYFGPDYIRQRVARQQGKEVTTGQGDGLPKEAKNVVEIPQVFRTVTLQEGAESIFPLGRPSEPSVTVQDEENKEVEPPQTTNETN